MGCKFKLLENNEISLVFILFSYQDLIESKISLGKALDHISLSSWVLRRGSGDFRVVSVNGFVINLIEMMLRMISKTKPLVQTSKERKKATMCWSFWRASTMTWTGSGWGWSRYRRRRRPSMRMIIWSLTKVIKICLMMACTLEFNLFILFLGIGESIEVLGLSTLSLAFPSFTRSLSQMIRRRRNGDNESIREISLRKEICCAG